MNIFTLYIFFLQFWLHQSTLIQPKKTCADCKYFISNTMLCKKFGDINLISGKIVNEKASIIRYDANKCGIEGKYFEKNNFKIVTIPYYFILENGAFIFSISYVFLPFLIWWKYIFL